MTQQIIHVPRRYVLHEWGGTETVISGIARCQLEAGYKAKVVTSMALAETKKETIHSVPVDRYNYCYPYFGLNAEQKAALDKKGGNLLSLSLLKGLLQERAVRLFHAHALKRLGGTVATAAKIRRKPLVVTLHGGVFDVPESEVTTMQKPVAGKMEWGKAFGAMLGSRSLLNDADMVVCVGENEYHAAKENLSHNRIAYLPNGVNASQFSNGNARRFRTKYQIDEDTFVILNVSRIDAQKNQIQLVEAFAQVLQTKPDSHLVLIGPETQAEYATKLKKRISQLGICNRVTHIPGLCPDDPELLDAYSAADTFVLPSVHEPFGIVVLEAWSAGKPVIASRVGGLKSLVDHENTGLFFETTAQLTDNLLSLAGSPDLRTSLGNAGKAEATAKYDWSRVSCLLEDIYQRAELYHEEKLALGRFLPISAGSPNV